MGYSVEMTLVVLAYDLWIVQERTGTFQGLSDLLAFSSLGQGSPTPRPQTTMGVVDRGLFATGLHKLGGPAEGERETGRMSSGPALTSTQLNWSSCMHVLVYCHKGWGSLL